MGKNPGSAGANEAEVGFNDGSQGRPQPQFGIVS